LRTAIGIGAAMKKIGIGRGAAGAALLAAAILAIGAVDPNPPDQPGPAPRLTPSGDPPAGQLLVASAQIDDPRFYHTVILLLRHDTDGAFGIIINHPVGEKTIRSLLESAGADDKTVAGSIEVLSGGPVEPQSGFVVHSAEYRRDGTMAVDDEVAMTGSTEVLRDIGHHQGPKRCFFAFGYAGWGAGQLEDEIARQDWFTAPADATLVFDGQQRGTLWQRALARRGQEL
jgi:putative transcriptional regulator